MDWQDNMKLLSGHGGATFKELAEGDEKFFLDTADIKEIREAQETGLLDGMTTNPSHVAKANKQRLSSW